MGQRAEKRCLLLVSPGGSALRLEEEGRATVQQASDHLRHRPSAVSALPDHACGSGHAFLFSETPEESLVCADAVWLVSLRPIDRSAPRWGDSRTAFASDGVVRGREMAE